MQSRIRKIEENRASEAFKCISERINCENIDKDKLKEYKSYIKKLPMLVKVNGLGSALAFVYSKKIKKDSYGWLYDDIKGWLTMSPYLFYINNKFKGELVENIINLDSQDYKAVTKEVLAFLNWLKRFAEGSIEGDEFEE